MYTYFENISIRLHVLYIFNTHVYLIHKLILLHIILNYKILKFKHLIDDIAIDF